MQIQMHTAHPPCSLPPTPAHTNAPRVHPMCITHYANIYKRTTRTSHVHYRLCRRSKACRVHHAHYVLHQHTNAQHAHPMPITHCVHTPKCTTRTSHPHAHYLLPQYTQMHTPHTSCSVPPTPTHINARYAHAMPITDYAGGQACVPRISCPLLTMGVVSHVWHTPHAHYSLCSWPSMHDTRTLCPLLTMLLAIYTQCTPFTLVTHYIDHHACMVSHGVTSTSHACYHLYKWPLIYGLLILCPLLTTLVVSEAHDAHHVCPLPAMSVACNTQYVHPLCQLPTMCVVVYITLHTSHAPHYSLC